MDPHLRHHLPARVKLIFNPSSGAPDQSPAQLIEIIDQMQSRNLIPEVYLVEPESNLPAVVEDAVHRGIRLVIVSGGDGTIDIVAAALAGTPATLGIIPTGTQNNVALSLGIPSDIALAVALLQSGRKTRVDMGLATCNEVKRPFLEACSVGLLSALFPAADDIQHGNLARLGDFLATLVASPPAEIRLVVDEHEQIETQGHVALVGNMPYVGPHYLLDPESSYTDGLLDVLVFANLSKLDLLGNVVQMAGGGPEDGRIRRYHVHSLAIQTNPAMPILADGVSLGEGALTISVLPHAVNIITGETSGVRGV